MTMPDTLNDRARKAAEEIEICLHNEGFNLTMGKKDECPAWAECPGYDLECGGCRKNAFTAIIVRHLNDPNTSALGLIATERRRQIEEEGFDAAHDDGNTESELAWAACYYAMPGKKLTPTGYAIHPSHLFPSTWDAKWAKGERKPRLEQLAVAGALIVAEMERLMRKEKG